MNIPAFIAIGAAIAIILLISRISSRSWLDQAKDKHDQEFRNKYEDILEAKKVRDYRQQEQKRREKFREQYRYDKHPSFEEWIEEMRKDGYKGNNKDQVRWYPTGWTWNEEKQLWEPPDYIVRESDERWEWDEEKKIWIDKQKAEKMEKYRQYRATQPMSYEEWKAAKMREEQEAREQNPGEYHYKKTEIPKDDI